MNLININGLQFFTEEAYNFLKKALVAAATGEGQKVDFYLSMIEASIREIEEMNQA